MTYLKNCYEFPDLCAVDFTLYVSAAAQESLLSGVSFKSISPCCCCCLQRFPLGGDDEVMSSTLQQFAKVIDEVRENTNTLELCLLLSAKFYASGFPAQTDFTYHDVLEFLSVLIKYLLLH